MDLDAQQHKPAGQFIIAKRYINFEAWIHSIVDYVAQEDGTPTTRATQLGITAEKVTELVTIKTDFDNLMDAYRKTSRSSSDIANIQDYELKFSKVLRAFRQAVKKGSLVELTGEDRENLHIHLDSTTKTPVKPMTVAPFIGIYGSTVGGGLNMLFSVPQSTADTRRRALPYGQHIIAEVWYAIVGEEPVGAPEIVNFGKSTHVFNPPTGTPPGTSLRIRARFVTKTTGIEGPVSAIKECSLAI